MFEQYLSRWRLQPDGKQIVTHSSHLLPVRRDGEPAMLKITHEAEEKFGGVLMQWWDGHGAARVLEYDGDAILLERAEGTRSLLDMAHNGQDDEASRIMCAVAAELHAPRNKPLPYLIPLTQWFQELEPAAGKYGGIFVEAATTARELFASPREVGVLHGDIHHNNVLDFGPRGWLVIDPKRLLGERGFDFANMLCNPDLATAKEPGRFLRQIDVIARAGNLERRRLLQWTLAYAGLSAAWFFSDGDPAETDLAVAQFAVAELKA
jgi:streptomycin 6-kinase